MSKVLKCIFLSHFSTTTVFTFQNTLPVNLVNKMHTVKKVDKIHIKDFKHNFNHLGQIYDQ